MNSIKQDLLTQLEDENVLFNVIEEGVLTDSGIAIENRKALINGLTGGVMGIVSTGYNTVSNMQIFDAFGDALNESGINTEDMKLTVAFAREGAKTLVNFRFPNEHVKMPRDDSPVVLDIAVLNSFDGSTRYMTKAGGFRVKCLNGMLLGRILGSYSSFHNQALDVVAGAHTLLQMLEQFKSAEQYWNTMVDYPVSNERALAVFGEFFKRDVDAHSTGRALLHMNLAWDRYVLEMGRNAYALYNTLTDFVSNKQYQAATKATGLLFNQTRLESILNTAPEFANAA